MIMNFIDYYWADLRASIRFARRRMCLQWKLLFAGAHEIATKGAAVGCSAETESITVTREVRIRVTREKVNIVAGGVEREAIVRAGSRVEIAFVEYKVAQR